MLLDGLCRFYNKLIDALAQDPMTCGTNLGMFIRKELLDASAILKCGLKQN